MSLKPMPIGPVPELTAYVAKAAFPDGNPYLAVRDALGTFYDDWRFAGLFPDRGRPAEAPWRLALVTVLQFAEGLADRQAADAVRGRIDWKYALGLELTDPGFDFSVLCEFRGRRGGTAVAGGDARDLQGTRPGPGPHQAAHRLDPRPGPHPHPQPPGVGGRDAPRRAE